MGLDVLLIEDDADSRANLRDILELDDHHVSMAATAAEALALGMADWSRYAVIILDRRLPDADPDALLPMLRSAAPEAAVIVVTGYSDLQGSIAALRQGASDYILKPINPEALRSSLYRISERRRLSRAQERSEAAFRHLVEAAECLIVIVRPDRSIVYFSPCAERLTGYSASEARGRDFFRLVFAEPEATDAAAAFLQVDYALPMHGYETVIVRRNGLRRWIVWNARYLADFEEGPAVLAVGQDITGLKQAQSRALQAERLAAIGQMVAGLAHESRNALQRGQACLEMLALQVADRPEATSLIARIQKAQDDLYHLFEDVRGYAVPIRLDRRDCDLTAVWRDAWNHLEPTRSSRSSSAILIEHVDGVDCHCLADPFRLEQVFRNILENALASRAGDAPVTIRVEVHDANGCGLDAPAVQIVVRDDGPGLSPEVKRRLFEPFFTTKTKGTGLGMPIARRIVEAHGGKIAVGEKSAEFPGATFIITLPRGNS